MRIQNCTPHDIVVRIIIGEGSKDITLPKSGIIPRVSTEEVETGVLGDTLIKYVTQKTGPVMGLPDPKLGVKYLVSGMVFAATDRPDVIAPDTGKTAIRDEAGQIVAVTRLLRK